MQHGERKYASPVEHLVTVNSAKHCNGSLFIFFCFLLSIEFFDMSIMGAKGVFFLFCFLPLFRGVRGSINAFLYTYPHISSIAFFVHVYIPSPPVVYCPSLVFFMFLVRQNERLKLLALCARVYTEDGQWGI